MKVSGTIICFLAASALQGSLAFQQHHKYAVTSRTPSFAVDNQRNSFPAATATVATATTSTRLNAASYEDVADIGFPVSVMKPMGVVFGENPDPYYGLVVDDVAEGLNGGMAGIRVGDQLLSVNGNVVVGKDFDSIMSALTDASSSSLDLVLYRGPVSSLFTILSNQVGDALWEEEDNSEDSQPVIMDENYESPVKIEVEEEKPFSPGDLFKAVQNIAKNVMEESEEEKLAKQQQKQQQKKSGFFGIGGESIQLDGDEASGLK